MTTPVEALALVLGVLDRMEIAYSIGGSVASSTHGFARMTNDVDLVIDLKPESIDEFCQNLKGEFYADPDLIRESFSRGRAANLIHYASAYKFDLFQRKKDEYSDAEFARRAYRTVTALGENIECAVASPEDTILRKLQWYRAGNEQSERQWDDVRGIVKTQSTGLDLVYLRKWAPSLNVADLLERLLSE